MLVEKLPVPLGVY